MLRLNCADTFGFKNGQAGYTVLLNPAEGQMRGVPGSPYFHPDDNIGGKNVLLGLLSKSSLAKITRGLK